MSAETVQALWVGPFVAVVEGGGRLTPGVTTHEVPRGEAEASDNWRIPVAAAPSPAPTPAAGTEED